MQVGPLSHHFENHIVYPSGHCVYIYLMIQSKSVRCTLHKDEAYVFQHLSVYFRFCHDQSIPIL